MEWGRGTSPPAGPGLSGTPVLFPSLFLSRCPREKCYTDGKITAGSFKSDFFFKKPNFTLLYLLSVEINKVLGLQICWYGDLNNMTRVGWGGKWTDPRPAGQGGLPCCLRPATAGHAFHGARALPPSPALASPFLKGLSAWAGAVGQSSGLMA